MDLEQRKKAQAMHRDFYDKINLAIEDGFYFEAYIREYNALEARMKVIMGVLGMPCETCENEELTNKIGIGVKLTCLKAFVQDKKNPIFEKTKLNRKMVDDICKWTQVRNKIIHRLYFNPDDYEKYTRQTKERAIIGKDYIRAIYNEADRLKRLKKRKPELFANNPIACHVNQTTKELPSLCVPIIEGEKNKGTQL